MEEEAKTKEVLKTICPCCGEKTLKLPVEPNAELKEQYLTCILSGVPFKQEYSLFDGNIKVTVTDISNERNDKLVKLSATGLILTDLNKRKATGELVTRLFKYFPLEKIVLKINGEEKIYNILQAVDQCILEAKTADTEKLQKLNDRLCSAEVVSSVPFAILSRVISTHEKQSEIITDSGFDNSFFQGIVLG